MPKTKKAKKETKELTGETTATEESTYRIAEILAEKPKKPHKRKHDDLSYSGKGDPNKKSKSHNSIFYSFYNRDQVTPTNEPRKSAAIINLDKIVTLKMDEAKLPLFQKKLEKAFQSVPSNRPLEKIEYSVNGSPRVAYTPGKTALANVTTNGLVTTLSNDPRTQDENVKQKTTPLEVFKTPSNVKPANSFTKKQKMVLKKGKSKPLPEKGSQNWAMAVSAKEAPNAGANKYVDACDVLEKNSNSEDNPFQWNHIEGKGLGGKLAEENLMAATKAMNGAVMSLETKLSTLAKRYSGVTVEGTGVAISTAQPTHIAEKYEYSVKTPHFEISLFFNGLRVNKPHTDEFKYLSIFIDSLCEFVEDQLKLTNPPSPINSIVTFSKAREAASAKPEKSDSEKPMLDVPTQSTP